MRAEAVRALVRDSFPEAAVTVRDMTGTGDHFEIEVVWAQFAGMTLVEQHQKVFAALAAEMDRGIHAVQLKTRVSA